MNLLDFIKPNAKRRQDIIERLLHNGDVTVREAMILMDTNKVIKIEKIELSSGAQIINTISHEQN